VGLRLLAGLLWLYNVSWKRAPDFGQDNDTGLYHFTALAVSDPVFPPYSWVVENLVLPNFTPFGWVVLVAETTLAVLLLSGAFVRLAAALGVAQSAAIGLSVALAPGEWPWAYAMMVGIHVVLLFSAAGRYLSVDALRAGIDDGRRLALTWGALGLVGGIVAVALSLGDPLDASDPSLRTGDFPVGIGTYNLLGGAVLLIVGGLLVGLARSSTPGIALGAAVVPALAALSLYASVIPSWVVRPRPRPSISPWPRSPVRSLSPRVVLASPASRLSPDRTRRPEHGAAQSHRSGTFRYL